MPDSIHVTFTASRTAWEKVWGRSGRTIDELEGLFAFYMSTMPEREAVRVFDGQLTRNERRRVKGKIQLNRAVSHCAGSIMAAAKSKVPIDTGALKRSFRQLR